MCLPLRRVRHNVGVSERASSRLSQLFTLSVKRHFQSTDLMQFFFFFFFLRSLPLKEAQMGTSALKQIHTVSHLNLSPQQTN